MSLIFHPLLALIASVTDRELVGYVEFLKEENKILRSRVPGQIHTKPHERDRLLKLGKPLGRAIEELLTIVSPSTFYRWLRDAGQGSKRKSPVSSGRRNPREVRELVIQIAKSTSFGYTPLGSEDGRLISTSYRVVGSLERIELAACADACTEFDLLSEISGLWLKAKPETRQAVLVLLRATAVTQTSN